MALHNFRIASRVTSAFGHVPGIGGVKPWGGGARGQDPVALGAVQFSVSSHLSFSSQFSGFLLVFPSQFSFSVFGGSFPGGVWWLLPKIFRFSLGGLHSHLVSEVQWDVARCGGRGCRANFRDFHIGAETHLHIGAVDWGGRGWCGCALYGWFQQFSDGGLNFRDFRRGGWHGFVRFGGSGCIGAVEHPRGGRWWQLLCSGTNASMPEI